MKMWVAGSILLITLSSPCFAGGGKGAGNGGDGVAVSFVSAARSDLEIIKGRGILALVDPNQLADAINVTKVQSQMGPLYDKDGIQRDALNFPEEKRVIVDRLRWGQLSPFERSKLALHEYLGILGIGDAEYQMTDLLLGAVQSDSNCDRMVREALLQNWKSQLFGGTSGTLQVRDLILLSNNGSVLVYDVGGQIEQADGGSMPARWIVVEGEECSPLSVTRYF